MHYPDFCFRLPPRIARLFPSRSLRIPRVADSARKGVTCFSHSLRDHIIYDLKCRSGMFHDYDNAIAAMYNL